MRPMFFLYTQCLPKSFDFFCVPIDSCQSSVHDLCGKSTERNIYTTSKKEKDCKKGNALPVIQEIFSCFQLILHDLHFKMKHLKNYGPLKKISLSILQKNQPRSSSLEIHQATSMMSSPLVNTEKMQILPPPSCMKCGGRWVPVKNFFIKRQKKRSAPKFGVLLGDPDTRNR